MKTIITLMVFLFGIGNGLAYYSDVYYHEGHGYKHLKGTTGKIVYEQICNLEIRRWTLDREPEEGDGIGDTCVDAIFTHGHIHIKELDMSPVKGENSLVKMYCPCDE